MSPWEKVVWWITMGLTVAVLVSLWMNSLVRLYKLFFCYLAADLIFSIAAANTPYHTKAYAYVYFSSQIVKGGIAAFMLVEVYSLALDRHPALARFGKSVVGYILAASAVIPLAMMFSDRTGPGYKYPLLRKFYLSEQTVDSTMAIFLILISIFLTWFPVRLRRNVIVYITGFTVWSLTHSAAVHLANQFQSSKSAIAWLNLIQTSLLLGCLLYWLLGFRREGEGRTAVVGHLWNRAEAERLTEQLNAINDSLERMRRR